MVVQFHSKDALKRNNNCKQHIKMHKSKQKASQSKQNNIHQLNFPTIMTLFE